MELYIVRREAGGGEIDEIVNVFGSKHDAISCIKGWGTTKPAEAGEGDDWQEHLAVGIYDDSERIWLETHNVVPGPPKPMVVVKWVDQAPQVFVGYDTKAEAWDAIKRSVAVVVGDGWNEFTEGVLYVGHESAVQLEDACWDITFPIGKDRA